MKVEIFTGNPIQQNGSIVYNEQKDAVIIDPSCYERYEQEEWMDFIRTKDLKVHAVLNTHCHIDHITGNAFFVEKLGVPFYAHKEELFTLSFADRSAQMYGLAAYVPSPEPTDYVTDNQLLKFGNLELKVIFGPGHSVGHVAFYSEADKILIGGDVLFYGSIGRTDLPGGNHTMLIKNIKEKILILPDDVTVYPGHGGETTIGFERSHNYYLK